MKGTQPTPEAPSWVEASDRHLRDRNLAVSQRAVLYRNSKFLPCRPKTHTAGSRKSGLTEDKSALTIAELDTKPIELNKLLRLGCGASNNKKTAIILG